MIFLCLLTEYLGQITNKDSACHAGSDNPCCADRWIRLSVRLLPCKRSCHRSHGRSGGWSTSRAGWQRHMVSSDPAHRGADFLDFNLAHFVCSPVNHSYRPNSLLHLQSRRNHRNDRRKNPLRHRSPWLHIHPRHRCDDCGTNNHW